MQETSPAKVTTMRRASMKQHVAKSVVVALGEIKLVHAHAVMVRAVRTQCRMDQLGAISTEIVPLWRVSRLAVLVGRLRLTFPCCVLDTAVCAHTPHVLFQFADVVQIHAALDVDEIAWHAPYVQTEFADVLQMRADEFARLVLASRTHR